MRLLTADTNHWFQMFQLLLFPLETFCLFKTFNWHSHVILWRMLHTLHTANEVMSTLQISYLGLSGGMTTKESVWRIMAKLFTNTLAKNINWRGRNNKQKIENLTIKRVIISECAAARTYCTSKPWGGGKWNLVCRLQGGELQKLGCPRKAGGGCSNLFSNLTYFPPLPQMQSGRIRSARMPWMRR